MRRNLERMERAAEAVAVGKLSGAVGTFAHLDPEVEAQVCERMGLKPAPVSTQTLQRDRHAEYLCTIAIIGCSLDKFATEIRHLQRTEVREAEEPFAAGQKGSSAMPHKRNPVKCEQVSGLSRVAARICGDRAWKMSPSGTNGIFRIPRPSGSSCRMRPASSAICSAQ